MTLLMAAVITDVLKFCFGCKGCIKMRSANYLHIIVIGFILAITSGVCLLIFESEESITGDPGQKRKH
jgi:hypothetical protein